MKYYALIEGEKFPTESKRFLYIYPDNFYFRFQDEIYFIDPIVLKKLILNFIDKGCMKGKGLEIC